MAYDFDLFVIGGGSAGMRASRVAARLGARVALAEERKLGGTCVNVGCVPKKLFHYAASLGESIEDARAYGWSSTGKTFSWRTLIENKDREIHRLNDVYAGLLAKAGVVVHHEHAAINGPHEVKVGNKAYSVANILIATGGCPARPDIRGADLAIVSDDTFHLPELPASIVIAGGGYVAVEFACIFHGLDVAVTLVHRGDRFLRGFDDSLREALADRLRAKGITLIFDATISTIERESELVSTLSNGTTLRSGAVLCATGRNPSTAALGLERAGVSLDAAGAVVVDRFSRSSTPSIWAVGDVTNRKNLTPVAIAEGAAAAQTMFGPSPVALDYDAIPSAVFSQPSIAAVGLTEADARARFPDIATYEARFVPLKHTLTGRPEKCLVKVVVDEKTDRVLGVHVMGDDAGEVVQGFAAAIKAGITKRTLDSTLGIHPTLAEELVTLTQRSDRKPTRT